MRYLFVLIILVFSLIGNSQENDKLFKSSALLKLQHAKEYTLKVADLMPAENYKYRPTEGEMNFGEQLVHLAGNLLWLSSSYLKGEESPVLKNASNPESKDSIRSLLVRTYDYAINVLSHFNDLHFSDTVNFFAGPMNKLQIINLINDHQTHHRGQLIVYLRLTGIKPPKYVGW